MPNFYYVYILTDIATGTHHYVGFTQDLSERLAKHNAGDVPHTSKFRPWRIQTAVASDSKEKAASFEDYLKSGSGRFKEETSETPRDAAVVFLRPVPFRFIPFSLIYLPTHVGNRAF